MKRAALLAAGVVALAALGGCATSGRISFEKGSQEKGTWSLGSRARRVAVDCDAKGTRILFQGRQFQIDGYDRFLGSLSPSGVTLRGPAARVEVDEVSFRIERGGDGREPRSRALADVPAGKTLRFSLRRWAFVD